MAKLATCPGCTTQLALPEEATLSDEARCPRCGEEFPLMEAVQFSIPTAELIPASERNASSEVVEWAAKPLERKLLDVSPLEEECTDNDESEIEDDPPCEPEYAEADQNATLSDWEARLKRAISDTEPSKTLEDPLSDTFQVSLDSTPREETKKIDTLQDFSFPHEDLEPQCDSEPKQASAPWAAVEAHEFEFAVEEPIAKPSAYGSDENLEAAPEAEMVIDSTKSPRSGKKKKRSFSRTMLSASLGVIGIPLGLYALLWIKGAVGDVAYMANYLPQVMLPPSMQSSTESLEESSELLTLEDSSPLPSEEEPLLSGMVADSEVQPATAEIPTYSGPRFEMVDRLEFGILKADAAIAAPALASGNIADKSDKSRKGHAYMALCRLADKFSFVNQPGLTAEDSEQVAEAQELIEATLTKSDVLADLPLIVGPWWEFEARPSSGIVLSGRVENVKTTATGSLALIQLGESSATIPVLLGGSPPALGAKIGIVGSIVNDPSAKIAALKDVLEPIVVAHFSFPIAGPSESEKLSAQPN